MNECIAKFVGFGTEREFLYRLPRSRGGTRLVSRKNATVLIDFVFDEELPPFVEDKKIQEEQERVSRIPYLRGCAERMRTPSSEGFQNWLTTGNFDPLTMEEITLLRGEIDLYNDMLRRRIPPEELSEWENRHQSAINILRGEVCTQKEWTDEN